MDELLLTGTVTLLLADIEGSTRLWQTNPAEMTDAIALLERTLCDVVAAHGGLRPSGQGEGGSFVVAFGRAADAVACALQLQQAPLVPIRLRIGIHTGDVQLRNDNKYVGPTISRTARIRDLAYGGQTLLSATTTDIVAEQLPGRAWLTDCGLQQLRDSCRPERVAQLCHPQLHNEFPPLRSPANAPAAHLPVRLTTFVGRRQEVAEVVKLVTSERLVTLIGAGGVGKSRLAVHVATELATEFSDGLCYVDLGPITEPIGTPFLIARALGLPDEPTRSTADTLLGYLRDRQMLIVLDNCEHLLDIYAQRIDALLRNCPDVTLLATSREPINLLGEVTWRVPSLSVKDDAVALFTDRARMAQPDFVANEENNGSVSLICQRLDGNPLSIELAAARVRLLSLTEIIAGLDDKIRLLTGGSRTALRRHQTLRASLDWSYGLLSEPERVLLRRLAVFAGGFDLQAVRAAASFGELSEGQVLDELASLVDKSLVVAERSHGRTRYRRLDEVGQYAMEKLHAAGEVTTMRQRYCDHYIALAALLDSTGRSDYPQLLDQAELELDNMRAAFGCCRHRLDAESALTLTSSLQSLWLYRGRIREGRTWFDSVLADEELDDSQVAPAVRARALADKAVLDMFVDAASSNDQAREALRIARELDDPHLLARTLTACGLTTGLGFDNDVVRQYFAEAADLARRLKDRWRLCQILSWQAAAAVVAGDAITAYATGREGHDLADALGNRVCSRQCRLSLAFGQLWRGDPVGAVEQFGGLVEELEGADADILTPLALKGLGDALAYQGDVSAARAAAEAAIERSKEAGEYFLGLSYATLAITALAAGDVGSARDAIAMAWRNLSVQTHMTSSWRASRAQVALADGDLVGAREFADYAVSATAGWHLSVALSTRAKVALAQGQPNQAERDAQAALTCAAGVGAHMWVPAILECLAQLAVERGSNREAGRLLGAAESARQRMGLARLKIDDNAHEASMHLLRTGMTDKEFDTAWAAGAAFSTEEAITFALRGRGEGPRATSGWAALTKAELDVVQLVGQGLSNKDVAARLFVSPRTVQSHLAHVYSKLGINSRVQLFQEAARHS